MLKFPANTQIFHVLQGEHFLSQVSAAVSTEKFFHHAGDSLPAQAVLIKINEEISFDKNLIIQAVDICIRVMMPYKVANARYRNFVISQSSKQAARRVRPFLLLDFSAAVTRAVFRGSRLYPSVLNMPCRVHQIDKLRVGSF